MTVATKVVLSALSTVLFIVAAFMLAATVTLGWLYGPQTNTDGFVDSPVVLMSTNGYAITSTDLDLGSVPDEWLPSSLWGKLQIRAQSPGGSPIFVGVGPSNHVGDYLANVEHAEVTRFGSQERLSYTEHAGSESPQPPADLEFWSVSSEGSQQQTLDWELESGAWTLVVMNSDADPGLDVSASLGVETPWISIGIWLTGGLTVMLTVGAVVIAARASKQPTKVEESDTGSPEPAPMSS